MKFNYQSLSRISRIISNYIVNYELTQKKILFKHCIIYLLHRVWQRLDRAKRALIHAILF